MFKIIKQAGKVVAVALTTATGSAFAALPTGVSAAVTGAGADGLELLGYLAVAGAGVYLLAKVLGRFGIKL